MTSIKEKKYGRAALEEALSQFRFPISKDELISCGGDMEVEFVKNHPIKLKHLLRNCAEERFESLEDFLTCEAVEDAVEAA